MKLSNQKPILSICAFLIAVCLVFSSCAFGEPVKNGKRECTVVLSEGRHYTCSENIKTVERGGDVDFTLRLENGYTFADTSYDDYDVEVSAPDGRGQRTAALTLNRVQYSAYISVELKEIAKTYTVSVNASEAFRCENSELTVQAEENAVFTLLFEADYTFKSVDYSGSYRVMGGDSDADENGKRRVTLILESIAEDTVVTVTEQKVEAATEPSPSEEVAVIRYDLNGGAFLDDAFGGTSYTVNYSLLHHFHPNTSIGSDIIGRYGYTLTGWNTKTDGSGEHIGLGSRAPIGKGESAVLYAEWAKQTDESLFDYVIIDTEDITALYNAKNKSQVLEELAAAADSEERSAVITRYHGWNVANPETLVIPERLDGYKVTVVATRTFYSDKLRSVVFPVSTAYIMERAFDDCPLLTEIYLYDNLLYIDGDAFGSKNPVQTIHINAVLMPIYGAMENGQFANKIEMLTERGKDPITVFFGSCSLWYGINAEAFGEKTGRTAYNMGLIGGTCTLYQLDLIKQHMKRNDTLIYLVETGSPFQWFYNNSFDVRVFVTVENNYDLLASLDMRRYSDVISAFNEYLALKRTRLEEERTGSYDDYFADMSDYGDLTYERAGGFDNFGQMYTLVSDSELLGNHAFERTREVLQGFADLWVDVYYGFGPLNVNSVKESEVNDLNELYLSQFIELEMPATMVGEFKDYILSSEYFYDANYHLSTLGAKYFTEKFTELFLSASQRDF